MTKEICQGDGNNATKAVQNDDIRLGQFKFPILRYNEVSSNLQKGKYIVI